MTSIFNIVFPQWDLTQSKFEEINLLPLMMTPGTVLMIVASYLLFVLKIGPALMTKREPYKLTTILLLYNFLQVLISSYIMIEMFKTLYSVGLFPVSCSLDDKESRKVILFNMWLYLAAKVTELLDTVFFVLRKKDRQITFLHLYHHTLMMVSSWVYLKYFPSYSYIFIGFVNSLIHVLMYTYYGLSALGPSVNKYIFWKKYMTKFQLIQFLLIIVYFTIAIRRSDCPPSKSAAIYMISNVILLIILFLNFYYQNYKINQSEKADDVKKADKLMKLIDDEDTNDKEKVQ